MHNFIFTVINNLAGIFYFSKLLFKALIFLFFEYHIYNEIINITHIHTYTAYILYKLSRFLLLIEKFNLGENIIKGSHDKLRYC